MQTCQLIYLLPRLGACHLQQDGPAANWAARAEERRQTKQADRRTLLKGPLKDFPEGLHGNRINL